jgi:hypothetical protein
LASPDSFTMCHTDLRRTCARLCHASGGEPEQIQFLLGHVSVQTTERYLSFRQRIQAAVNDRNPAADACWLTNNHLADGVTLDFCLRVMGSTAG